MMHKGSKLNFEKSNDPTNNPCLERVIKEVTEFISDGQRGWPVAARIPFMPLSGH
jgi:hypothetical protein